MTHRDETRDTERLPEDAARRLFTRATELEAAGGADVSVAELREAALAAGIAPRAFEQALAELRGRDPAAPVAAGPPLTGPRRLARFWPAALAASLVLAILAVFVSRLFP
jgi:hypothetical protein